jgi:hypothetical protein
MSFVRLINFDIILQICVPGNDGAVGQWERLVSDGHKVVVELEDELLDDDGHPLVTRRPNQVVAVHVPTVAVGEVRRDEVLLLAPFSLQIEELLAACALYI